MFESHSETAYSAPMGITDVQYCEKVIPCEGTTLSTLTSTSAIIEQKNMCHIVSVIGNGKPANASSHLLKTMTAMDTDIHRPT